MSITITTTGDRISVVSPYNKDFVDGARNLGGRFDGASKAWTFDARDEARARELLIDVYGTDGSPVAETVTLHIDLAAYPGYRVRQGHCRRSGGCPPSRPRQCGTALRRGGHRGWLR